jgi:hypothetical protein
MARMIPKSPPDFHGSVGEERVFRSLRSLPDNIVVIHSFRWLHPGNASVLTRHLKAQGEGDFVLFDPARGVMVVEVKGGEVWCEGGEWRQRNRRTGQVQIIFPEAQASDTAYRIRPEVIEKVPEAEKLLYCHAVWFPDGAIERSKLPVNYHRDITFDAEDVAKPAEAIQRAFDYWAARFPGRRGVSDDIAHRVVDALAPSLSIVRSVRQALDEREEIFIRLTQEQARIIEFLDEQLHAAILGAAGTGKTLLAVEKARRLASPARPVLFLCFNAALRQHLNTIHTHPNVRYLTFHGLARELIGSEGPLEQAEQDLVDHLLDEGDLPGEHVIIDEGQDFKTDWLEALHLRFQNKAFYVFYDRYQIIQGEMDTRWIDQIPCRLVLTRNCRNTDPIARVAYRAGGLAVVPTLGVIGPRPVLHAVSDSTAAVKIVSMLVETACTKVSPHEIAILTLETLDEGNPWQLANIAGHHSSDQPKTNCITVTTVRRFKGLEASLIIVVDVDLKRAVDDDWRRRLYVACSRARHAVHIITTTKEIDLGGALRAFAGTEKTRPSWRALSRQLGVRLAEGGNIDPFNEPKAW